MRIKMYYDVIFHGFPLYAISSRQLEFLIQFLSWISYESRKTQLVIEKVTIIFNFPAGTNVHV